MRYTPITLGGSTLQMPAVTLGSVWFGTRVDKQTAFAQMDAYYASGGRWIDTARVYGRCLLAPGEITPGMQDAEEVVGEWIASRGVRSAVTVITKGAHWDLATKKPRVTPEAIRQDFTTSLAKLGLEYVDIWFMHYDDEDVPVEQIMPVLHELAASGRVKSIGVSNWRSARIEAANRFAQQQGLTPIAISQIQWSFALPTAGQPIRVNPEQNPGEMHWYRQTGMPVMAYSSQAAGFFIKLAKYGADAEKLGPAASFLSEANLARSAAVQAVAAADGVSIAAASFAPLYTAGMPVTALIGPSSLPHLEESLRDADYQPSKEAAEIIEKARQARQL